MDRTQTRPFTSIGPHGHRSRMRGRLLADETALADYEILEMLLFLGIPRRDTKPLAKGLINRFGSLSGTLEASRSDLAQAGLPGQAIAALETVVEAAGILAQPDAVRRPVVSDLDALTRYLNVAERVEQGPGMSALLLNNRNQVLGEPAWEGNAGPDASCRFVLRHALDQHATAVILLRNAGRAAPVLTDADRFLHARLQREGAPLSVVVHDLVVIGGRGSMVSARRTGH